MRRFPPISAQSLCGEGIVMKYCGFLLAAAALALGPSALSPCAEAAALGVAARCCKTCSAGKACGNSCIAAWKTCHQPKGCACNG